MFKIEVFVEDRKLAEVLKSLAGQVRGQPSVVPVVNVEETAGGGLRAATNGNLVHMLIDHLTRSKIDAIKPKEIGAWLVKKGMSKLSTSYVARGAVKEGALKKTGSGQSTVYHVVKRGGK